MDVEGGRTTQKALYAALAACFSSAAGANPVAPVVTSSAATFAQSGKTLQITDTPGGTIQWHVYSTAADEPTRFLWSGAAPAASCVSRRA